MPDVWMPGLIKDPGNGANYAAGSNAMQFVVHHDTGGSNSYQICKNGRPGYNTGLCQILLPKNGVPWQFVPIDAVSYHCGSSADYDHDGDRDDYNPIGPGLEVERFQGEPLTADQTHWLGEIGRWLESEWGIPNVQYRGPQYGADDFRGHVNHRDLHPNPDGLSPDEFDAVTATAPKKRKVSEDMILIGKRKGNRECWLAIGSVLAQQFTGPPQDVFGLAVPADAVAFSGGGDIPIREVADGVMDTLEAIAQNGLNPPAASGGTGNPVSYTITGKAVPE